MRIDHYIHFTGERRIIDLLDQIVTLVTITGEQTMATLQEVQDAIVQLKQDIVSEKAEVQGKLADLSAQVQALTDQINAGGAITQADLDALAASIADIDAGVKDISEPAAPV